MNQALIRHPQQIIRTPTTSVVFYQNFLLHQVLYIPQCRIG